MTLGSNCKAWSSPALLGTTLLLDWRWGVWGANLPSPHPNSAKQVVCHNSFEATADELPWCRSRWMFWGGQKYSKNPLLTSHPIERWKINPCLSFHLSLSLSNFSWHIPGKDFNPGKRLVLPSVVFACQAQAETSDATGSSAVIVELQSRRNSLSLQDHTADGKKILHHLGCIKPYETWDLLTSFRISSINRKNTEWKMMTFPRTKGSFLLQTGSFSTVNWENETNLLRSWEPPEKIYSNAIRSLLGAPGVGSQLQVHIIGFLWFPAKDVYLPTSDVFSKWKHAKMDVKLFFFFLPLLFLAYNSFFFGSTPRLAFTR